MADCSATGTAIDRAARAVLGGASAASSAAATKHVGALLGHASMFSATNAATKAISMPLASPDHLVIPGARVQLQSRAPLVAPPLAREARAMQQQHQQQGAPSSVSSQQQHPLAIHHPAVSAAPRNLTATPVHQYQQQQQHLHHQHQHQQMQMQLQMQQHHQQQQVMAMMLRQRQQQQQQQFQIQQQQQQQQQHLEQSKAAASKDQHQEQQKPSAVEDDWHQGLEEDFLREREAIGDDLNLNDEGIRAITGGAGIDELAAAWAEAEAEYDSVLLDNELQRRQQEGDQLVDDDNYANLWQGESNLQSLLTPEPRPYEFMNAVALDIDTTVATSSATANNKNYMEEGMKNFREGNIKEAIASFEMELQLQNTDNATAWRMLGKCHAENDQDPEAIQCFEAAVDRDPFCPEALLALGVSYVNELNHERALENMKAWFTHNPKYAGLEFTLPSSNNTDIASATRNAEDDIYGAASEKNIDTDYNYDNPDDITKSHRSTKESAFDEVKSMLLAALEFDPTDAGDVYEALGIIYSVIKDYDSAVDSFRKALESRPNDYQLWNKLGATLANGSQPDQALPMYAQSLKFKPKYARAWLNMAISHSNLLDHDEAARCYLQTLSLNPGATHCWTYLRMSLSSKERWDLLPLVFERNLKGFKEHFDFVLYS
uniref:Uncharacterized protein n=1 Tax=Pseudo-nitzschia australis TaxID=44445 RepID=A0A6U9ZWP5_9STRA|mmetsp:Transcript_8901/g.19218  ORF Transcript_8901/g.19218 Transcript_8901/m.19218 type:complete len:660 (-) Transcript_8901:144-2123(-)|eukprot:CAMPEP_0168248098 /NCGR_PEP_ID=MMETSP0141_2-20121125/1272_1 /TAXON_ID=44445 /ORGANISM="Pseudo-nitzschia australis, Strain 10249 10 AB" /LENGTH=659 /DNA_ID=CAMNT_0008183973 /DNA_START=124 /DNA_END=2103 /DNA_ORIENTATION=-